MSGSAPVQYADSPGKSVDDLIAETFPDSPTPGATPGPTSTSTQSSTPGPLRAGSARLVTFDTQPNDNPDDFPVQRSAVVETVVEDMNATDDIPSIDQPETVALHPVVQDTPSRYGDRRESDLASQSEEDRSQHMDPKVLEMNDSSVVHADQSSIAAIHDESRTTPRKKKTVVKKVIVKRKKVKEDGSDGKASSAAAGAASGSEVDREDEETDMPPTTGPSVSESTPRTTPRGRSEAQRASGDANGTVDYSAQNSRESEEGVQEQVLPEPSAVHEHFSKLFGRSVPADAFSNNVLQIEIKRTEALRADSFPVHPVVRVSMVDLETGMLLQKPDAGVPVSTHFEYTVSHGQDGRAVSGKLLHVLPIMTKPCDLRQTCTTVAQWNETIVFNVDYLYCLRPNVVLFFEVLDFGVDLPLGRKIRAPDGLSRIAWGYLRLVNPVSGLANTERAQTAIQLYAYDVLRERKGVSRVLHSCVGGDVTVLPGGQRATANVDHVPFASVYGEYQKLDKKNKYPAVLYVSVKGMPTVQPQRVRGRAMHAFEEEIGSMDFDELRKSTLASRKHSADADGQQLGNMAALDSAYRRRRTRDPCEIPDALLFQFDSGDRGATVLRISDNGRVLAAGCWGRFFHSVRLWDLENGRLLANMDAHRKLIHDLAFASLDTELISASSDGTVCVFSVAKYTHPVADDDSQSSTLPSVSRPAVTHSKPADGRQRRSSASAEDVAPSSEDAVSSSEPDEAGADDMRSSKSKPAHPRQFEPAMRLQHPCFVYCARAHPTIDNPRLIFTGGYDHNIRVFNRETGTLLRVLSGHQSHVNSLVFDNQGARMYSGDGDGVIKIWSTRVRGSGKTPGLDLDDGIVCLRTVAEKEMIGRPINSLRLSPTGKLLLVTSRDNLIRTFHVDLASTSVAFRFTGARIERYAVRGDFSPCGQYVVSGSENGSLYFWNAQQGELLPEVTQTGLEVGFTAPLCAVAWSPTQHVLAVASFGSTTAEPIRVLCYEHDEPVYDDDEDDIPVRASVAGSQALAAGAFRMEDGLMTGSTALGSASSLTNITMGLSAGSVRELMANAGMTAMPTLIELVRARKRMNMAPDRHDPTALATSSEIARDRMELIFKEVARMRTQQQQMSLPAGAATATTSSTGATGLSSESYLDDSFGRRTQSVVRFSAEDSSSTRASAQRPPTASASRASRG